MITQGDLAKFLNSAGDVQKLNDLVDDIREAVMDYQVRIFEGLVFIVSYVCLRLPYTGIFTTIPVNYWSVVRSTTYPCSDSSTGWGRAHPSRPHAPRC